MLKAIAKTLQSPFLFSLSLLERSCLPLQAGVSAPRAFILYSFQLFKGVLALCSLLLSLPSAALILLFHILLPRKGVVSLPQGDCDSLHFPTDFKVGVADSLFQSCGVGLFSTSRDIREGSSDWNRWIQGRFPNGKPRLEGEPDLSRVFINYLDNPDILIEKLRKLGVNTYRFSLERSMLEPEEGRFNEAYLQKYQTFIGQLTLHGIQPFLTLHHFVNPEWFLQKGGFEKSENIEGFVRYCETMFAAFGDSVTHWVTINEPAIYAYQAYIRCVYPPGKRDFSLAAEVMKNMLIAHCLVYQKAKAKYPSLQIGISHNWLSFEPYSFYNPVERLACYYASEITHRAILRFFQTGKFSLQIPFVANVEHFELQAPQCLDFIGVQYYTKPLIRVSLFSAKSTSHRGKKMTNLGARFYPEGLQEALLEASTLNRVVWITETGCDIDQIDFFKQVFSIMSHSVEQGIPLAGALIWTLRDNLEWERGDSVKIGLHHSNFEEKPVVQEVIRPLFQRIQQRSEATSEVAKGALCS